MAPRGGGVCTEKKKPNKNKGSKKESVRDCFKISTVAFYFERGRPVRNKEKCYFCRKKKLKGRSGNEAVSLHRTRFYFYRSSDS